MLPSIFGENLFDSFFSEPFRMFEREADPVSYTHLDVYKRQATSTVQLAVLPPASAVITAVPFASAVTRPVSSTVALSLIHIW